MSAKSFIGGLLTGVVLTFTGIYVVRQIQFSMDDRPPLYIEYDPIHYFDIPVSYENKKSTSFKVFQVLNGRALANEISNKQYGWYEGTTILLIGDDFYNDQIVTVNEPQRIGTYSYTTKSGMPMTVPVIDEKK